MQIMACSKASMISFLLLIVSTSSFNLCFGDNTSSGNSLDQLLPGLGQVSIVKDAQCIQKLLPCQPFLKNPVNPPETCCAPLHEVANNASECLCTLLNKPKLFASVEGSKDEILKLPNACGITVDDSKCSAGDDGPTEDSSSTKMITSYGITYFVIALLTALVFSAY